MNVDKLLSVFKKGKATDQGLKAEDLKINVKLSSAGIIILQINAKLFPDQSILVSKKEFTEPSPLLKSLFKIKGILEIFVNDDSMRVKCSSGSDLKAIAKEIGGVIRSVWGQELIPQSILKSFEINTPSILKKHDYPILRTEIGKQINQILSESIAPGLASHGGSVELVDVVDNMVHLKFMGGCQGCGQVTSTVKYGIEKLLKDKFPNLTGVVDVTDHASGENPYY